ncbi:FAD binding domain containing protein [Acanthamoeba castellanii str. Neff]|uniref:NADPH--hemoprotein reductase n=1 Tax=Acanthamoeba castellanii (strain ATCC 30010 / Neff) TaxID=1257118 RepID=L8HBU6_ACACF|nr:FAD binding domain containing protein [Acanthamoeba castellanii str. Neff]ELR22660.1 FAD binding domain containing protein [Acanthamoeba castellanii str. Neff]
MKVLWGSQTGTATGFADDLARELSAQGITATSMDLRKYNSKKLATEKEPLALVLACYGQGEPTDNAKQFYDFVMAKERKQGSLKDVRYTVFGLGQSKAYPACYQAVGRSVDKRLEELGAQRIFARGEGDDSDDVEADFTAWKDKLLQSLTGAGGDGESADAANTTAAAAPAAAAPAAQPPKAEPEKPSVQIRVLDRSAAPASTYQRNPAEPISIVNPVEARVVENEELQSAASDRSTRHLEIELSNTGITYQTGDYLGVFPVNDEQMVNDLLQSLNIDPDQVIALKSAADGAGEFSTPRTIKQHFLENVDLTGRPRKSLFARLSAFAGDEATRARLSSDDYAEFCVREKRGLYHILKDNPSLRLGLDSLLSLAPPLLPRYYSIASSPKFKEGRMQLTVALAKTKAESGADHYGVCSRYICALKPGQTARLFVKTSLFRLPKSPEVPIIMVAAGCGIAPFHGFMQERKLQCDQASLPYEKSKNVLYFGVYSKSKDFLYESELTGYERDGLLKLRMAFSEDHAPNQPPTFAQHRMMEDMPMLWQLIEKEQANTYVCGHTLLFDGVKEALQRTMTEVGRVPANEANDRIAQLQNSGRLQVDVY